MRVLTSLTGHLLEPYAFDVRSNFTGESLGQRMRIESFAFRDVPLE